MMLNDIKLAFSENKVAIVSAIAILLITIILGYLLEPYLHSVFNPVVEEITNKVKTGALKITFLSIFSNNIRVVFLMFIMGLIVCFSAVILAFNGFFTGYYVATCDDLYYTLLLIIPHGIFEFSSCILACASGFVLFNFIIKFLKSVRRQDDDSFKGILYNSFAQSKIKLKQAIILLMIASVLMAIAGFVEAYLTIPIADYIMAFT